MINEVVEALQLLIESSLSDVNTSTPGTIISYDAARNRAIVRPSLPKALSNGDSLDPPQIIEVPVVWPANGGGAGSFTMPLKPGDGVMLSFQHRSLEGWLNGNNAMPDDPRQFDLSDCVAHPGLAASGIVAHSDNVVLKFNKSSLTIDPNNNITIGNDKASIVIDQSGNITLNAQSVKINTPAVNFTLETHRHKDTQGQIGSTSGTPI
jgi:hypothetical protein